MALKYLLLLAVIFTTPASATPSSEDLALKLESRAAEFFEKGRYEDSAHYLRRALELRRTATEINRVPFALSNFDLAQIYIVQGKFTAAEHHSRLAHDWCAGLVSPQFRARISVQLAEIHFRVGDNRSAEMELLAALPHLSGIQEANAWNDLGMVRAKSSQWVEARQLFERALAIREQAGTGTANHPDHGRVLANLAQVSTRLGEFDAAAGYYRSAIPLLEQRPGLAQYHASVAWAEYAKVLRKTGRKAEAKEAERRAKSMQQIAPPPKSHTVDVRSFR